MTEKPIAGRRLGRRPIADEGKDKAVRLYNAEELTVNEICRVCGISRTSLFRFLRERRETDGKGTEV